MNFIKAHTFLYHMWNTFCIPSILGERNRIPFPKSRKNKFLVNFELYRLMVLLLSTTKERTSDLPLSQQLENLTKYMKKLYTGIKQ